MLAKLSQWFFRRILKNAASIHVTVNNAPAPPHTCDEDDLKKWTLMPGRESSSTAEARFACNHCGREMFLGGFGSALWLDPTIRRS